MVQTLVMFLPFVLRFVGELDFFGVPSFSRGQSVSEVLAGKLIWGRVKKWVMSVPTCWLNIK